MRAASLFCAFLLSVPGSADAAELIFNYNGVVNSETLLGGLPKNPSESAPIKVGDNISAQFTIDPGAVILGACIPLGGGLSCSYSVTLQDYILSVGSYIKSFAQLQAAFYIQNDVFSQDALGFAYTDVTAGPFDSTLTGVQFQGRYSNDTLTSSDFSGSLPFEAADWSLFTLFTGPLGRVDFRGPLSLHISSVPAVPEPSSWLMMIFGIGSIGTAMRRKRKLRTTLHGA